jgi:acetyltransferase-like isoleucine patch superfamily enzyme
VRIETGQTLKASRGKNARAELLGVLSVAGWGGSNLPSSLMLGKDSSLRILGDLSIGPNVHISTSTGATVEFGGVRHSSGSGITCNSRIMAEKCIKVGADSIIAWDVLVTDSDWHNIDGSQRIETVEIGERVWIAHGVSVLKGSYIPHGSVVGAKSLVQKRFSGNSLLLAGNPARIIREAVRWER